MVALTALVVVSLGYPAILVENFPYNAPPLIVNVICALGVGSLISLLAFAGLGMIYRKKQDQRKEACQTAFLQQCILYDESTGRQELEEIAQIQRNARSVQHAAWLMAALTALVVAGLYLSGVFAGEPSRERAAIHREPALRPGCGIPHQPPGFCRLGHELSQEARSAAAGKLPDGRQALGVSSGKAARHALAGHTRRNSRRQQCWDRPGCRRSQWFAMKD